MSENDDAQRYAIYQKMDAILIDEAPVIFLFYDESSRFAKADIEGLSRNALNLLPLKRRTKRNENKNCGLSVKQRLNT
ncbi:MAG: hypothetical protein HC803_05310 [Saprospiraceae bacterium]|nr:hypothetical protein [Saprospiraceae bacterium]